MASIGNIASSVDLKRGPIKNGTLMDSSSTKVMAQDKLQNKASANASSGSPSSTDDAGPHKKFDRVLSDATAAKSSGSSSAATRTKADASDQDAASKPEETSPPDISLLMSLLPTLPQPAAAAAPPAALATQDLTNTKAPITATQSNSATAAPAAAAMTAQSSLPDVLKAADTNTSASALPSAVIAALSTSTDGKSADKADSFGAVLANIDAATATSFLAGPTPQAVIATTTATALAATVPGAISDLPVTHNEWPAALGHQLLWTIGEGLQKAEISVTPQDMGPINVHIRIENDKTDIRFTATHAVTREALESSIPRLREMFSQQGLNLSQAQVFSQTSQDSNSRNPDPNQANPNTLPNALASDTAEKQEQEKPQPRYWRRGLVDDYA